MIESPEGSPIEVKKQPSEEITEKEEKHTVTFKKSLNASSRFVTVLFFRAGVWFNEVNLL